MQHCQAKTSPEQTYPLRNTCTPPTSYSRCGSHPHTGDLLFTLTMYGSMPSRTLSLRASNWQKGHPSQQTTTALPVKPSTTHSPSAQSTNIMPGAYNTWSTKNSIQTKKSRMTPPPQYHPNQGARLNRPLQQG